MKTQTVRISPQRISNQSEWIARDGAKWVVKVPVAGGRKDFNFIEYGDSHKALIAARSFHTKMEKKLRATQDYIKKHGERPIGVRSDNNTGVPGITRIVYPKLTGRPNIVFRAYYSNRHKGIWLSKDFSTHEYIDEKKAFEEAKKQRRQWEKQHGK